MVSAWAWWSWSEAATDDGVFVVAAVGGGLNSGAVVAAAAAAAVAVPWQEAPRVVGHLAWDHAAVPFAASC